MGKTHPGGIEHLEHLPPVGEMDMDLVEHATGLLDAENDATSDILHLDV